MPLYNTTTNSSLNNLSNATGVAIHGSNTNDSAAAGYVGETITANIARSSAVSLSTATAKTVAGITLTAGDWIVHGAIGFIFAASTSSTSLQAAVSLTTNTSPSATTLLNPTTSEMRVQSDTPAYVPGIAGSDTPQFVPSYRVSLSSTTNLFLVANATFTASTMTAYGFIQATRIR